MFHEISKEEVVSKMFQVCFMISKGVSRVLQRIFQGVWKNFYVSRQSSQLPEQKEGLF